MSLPIQPVERERKCVCVCLYLTVIIGSCYKGSPHIISKYNYDYNVWLIFHLLWFDCSLIIYRMFSNNVVPVMIVLLLCCKIMCEINLQIKESSNRITERFQTAFLLLF